MLLLIGLCVPVIVFFLYTLGKFMPIYQALIIYIFLLLGFTIYWNFKQIKKDVLKLDNGF